MWFPVIASSHGRTNDFFEIPCCRSECSVDEFSIAHSVCGIFFVQSFHAGAQRVRTSAESERISVTRT